MSFVTPEIDYVWCSDYHDHPRSGLARHQGLLCWFDYRDDTNDFELKPLARLEKLRAIAQWRWFEICVGKHWSKPEGPTFQSRRGQWFWRRLANLYYGKEVFLPRRKP